MKVRQLIKELEQFDDDKVVCFAYDYGDHWHTTVSPKVNKVDECGIRYSDYHNKFRVVDEDDKEPPEEHAVVLFS